MKKIVLIMLILISPMALYSKFNAGIDVGYNATQLNANLDDVNSNLKSGLQVGVFARFGDSFFIQPELLYASRGGFTEFQNEIFEQFGKGTELHTGIFQIPVMLGVKILDGDLLGANIQAGPVMSLIASKGLAGVSDVFTQEGFEDFSWGVQVGGGIDFMSFSLNVRYEYAMSDIYKGSFDGNTLSAKANTFLVTIGWKLL